ncbi:MAG: RNA polymerase sigma factor [Patescibacteria group bacterium]
MDIRKAFLEAYDRHADAIYRHCYFRVFSKARAEELVQETFMKTWDYLGKGGRVENMKAFLYRVATNLIVDESRKRKEASLDAMRESGDFNEPAGDGALDAEKLILMREVCSKIAELEPEDKAVIVMRYVDDLDPQEIAEVLEITPNNVSVRLNRAMKKLKEQI